jgi:radical SAM superfamily enzyme
LQLLHILKGTDLAEYYQNSTNGFTALGKQEYLDLLIGCIECLSPDIVIHRVTGDGPKDLLIAPTWSLNKRDVLNSLHRQMREQNAFQGRLYQPN